MLNTAEFTLRYHSPRPARYTTAIERKHDA